MAGVFVTPLLFTFNFNLFVQTKLLGQVTYLSKCSQTFLDKKCSEYLILCRLELYFCISKNSCLT